MERPRRRHTEVLREVIVPFAGKLVDIGCGRGALVGWFRKHGIDAFGIDPQDVLRPSLSAVAERLPLADGSMNHVLFFNSLHHVPVAAMDRALAEAARILDPTGRLVVIEPLASGRHFALMQPLEDETTIRNEAREAMRRAERSLFVQDLELEYDTSIIQTSLEQVLEEFIDVDPARKSRIATLHGDLARLYAELGRPCDKGMEFNQPMRLNLFSRKL